MKNTLKFLLATSFLVFVPSIHSSIKTDAKDALKPIIKAPIKQTQQINDFVTKANGINIDGIHVPSAELNPVVFQHARINYRAFWIA